MLSSRLRAAAGVTTAVALLGLAACGTDSGANTPSASPGSPSVVASSSPSASASASARPAVKASTNTEAVKATGAYGKAPKVAFKAPFAIDKTQTRVLEPSEGAVVKDGQTVEVNYHGVNGRTGKVFDESFTAGQPVAFSLDGVVPGFKKGLVGQRQGSRVLIAMPGPDGYDASGGNPQGGIEVGDTLLFVVDLVGVQLEGPEGEDVKPKAGLPTVSGPVTKPVVTVPKTAAPKTLQIQPLIKGAGKKVAAGDTITFNYQWLNWDGKVLEQSYGAQPANFELAGLLPGMQKGLVNQTVGSRVLLVIPPAQGYPDGNASPPVQKGETLVMVVDLLFTQTAR